MSDTSKGHDDQAGRPAKGSTPSRLGWKAGGVYLKKPERVMALLMVMTWGVLIYSLVERNLRTALTEKDETLPDQKGKPTQRATMRRIF